MSAKTGTDTKTLRRWNVHTHEYEDRQVPQNLRVTTYSSDMNERVDCPECQEEFEFGDGFTSRLWHTGMGMGYSVCPSCHENEVAEEMAELRSRNHTESKTI